MVTTQAQSPKSRLNFPFKEPEQWWEIWHNTERSLAAQFAKIPVNAVAMQLLKEPYLADGFSKNVKKSFLYATYEYLENVFLRTTGAQTIRSWASLYGKDKKFQQCIHAGELLSGLTASAAYYDQDSMPLVEELQKGRASPVHDFVFHSQDANQMMSDFVTGEMEVTPTNLRQFEQHLQALSELSAQPIAMAQEMRVNSTKDVTPHTRPSDYIREVLQAKQLQNPRQLQILFSLIPPLITHGALALSHVEYVPQEKRFLSVEQSVKLSKAVEAALSSHRYEYNHDMQGNPLIEGVPKGAIVKKAGSGYEVLSEQELLQFGNRLLHQTKAIAGENINRVLAYADEHFEAVEQQLLNSVYTEKPKAVTLEASSALVPPELTQSWKVSDKEAPHSHQTHRWKSYLGAAFNYAGRPEAQHEKTKLLRRKIPIQFSYMPVTVIKDMLKLTNANPTLIGKALRGEKFTNPYDSDKESQYDWNRHLKKEAWGLVMNPLAGSHGLVSVKEFASTGKKLTGDSIKNLNKHLSVAIESGLTMDTAIQQSLQQSRSAIHQKKLSIPPALKAKVEHVQQKDPRNYEREDYAILQQYFQTLSQAVNQQGEALLSPYQKDKTDTLPDIINRNLLQPVADLPSALTTLSFIQSVLEKEQTNIDSLEFVDPKKNLIPVKSFRMIAETMESQLTAAGIAIVGENYQGKPCNPEGFKAGSMVQFNHDSNRYEAVQPEMIIRLANVVSKKFKQEIGANAERISQGAIDKTHYAFVEKSLFSLPKEKKNSIGSPLFSGAERWNSPEKTKHDRSFFEKLKAAWKHATRPEAIHEAKLLWSRTTFARVTGIPVTLWQNIRKGFLPYKDGQAIPEYKKNASIKDIIQKPGGFISKGSLLSELWISIAYPIGEFVSTIGREMTRYKVADAIADSAHASDSLDELLHKAATLSNDWETEYREQTGKSAALEQVAAQESFKMIPRIAMKPAHLRMEHENLLMQQYMEQAGSVALASASQLMNGSNQKKSNKNTLLEQPAKSLVEAHEALATIKTLMDASRQHLGVLRFVDPSKIMIDSKGLAQLSETIEAQYQAADKAGDLNTEQGFVRLTNVIRNQFLAVADIEKMDQFIKKPSVSAPPR
ncbi:MAG: hypothetical protein P8P30_02095 [Rickettsiales bacterium]|nr:hypothetical protein [Rickettsiales bacterium]